MQIIKQIYPSITRTIITIIICLTVVAGVSLVSAWTGPTATPPDGNTPTPINIGAIQQIKSGPLQVNGFRNIGSSIFDGYVGIGTIDPKSLLHIKSDSPSVNAMINLENDLGVVNQIYTGRSAGGIPGHLVLEPATGKNTIINSGNVGIGKTVDPGTNKLQVNGNIQAIGGDICTDQGGGKCLSAAGGAGNLAVTTPFCNSIPSSMSACARSYCSISCPSGYARVSCLAVPPLYEGTNTGVMSLLNNGCEFLNEDCRTFKGYAFCLKIE